MHIARFISGFVLLAFMAVGLCAGSIAAWRGYAASGHPDISGLMNGSWVAGFEKKLNENLTFSDAVRSVWGRAEFATFGQGRKGVIVGRDGWLFTDEEFSCPRGADGNIAGNLDFIKNTHNFFARQKIPLIIALIPAKADFHAEYVDLPLPPCRAGLYERALKFFNQQGINAARGAGVFLKTDTHWSPDGAQAAAQAIASTKDLPTLPRTAFKTEKSSAADLHTGDLLRYLPGVETASIHPEPMTSYETRPLSQSSDLFGDAAPPVTLIGTSYSANPKWNFEGFLKQALSSDVLNLADEGKGPFTVMQSYMDKPDQFVNNPPKLIVWEIPVRYLPLSPPPKNKSEGNKS